MSTDKIYRATIKQIMTHRGGSDKELLHLDIGSGSGELVKRLKEQVNTRASCCDYTDELMQLPGQRVDVVDLNSSKVLPYQDDTFDVVTATEVIEHLEDFRALLREISRVLKVGGVCVISTPNILNLKSRLRNLCFGFAELMGPLPVESRKIESCAGHINPVSLFYIMHALREINFSHVDAVVDKYQRSGIVRATMLWLPIKAVSSLIWRREAVKYKTINETNENIVKRINSLPILLGRTVIISAVK